MRVYYHSCRYFTETNSVCNGRSVNYSGKLCVHPVPTIGNEQKYMCIFDFYIKAIKLIYV